MLHYNKGAYMKKLTAKSTSGLFVLDKSQRSRIKHLSSFFTYHYFGVGRHEVQLRGGASKEDQDVLLDMGFIGPKKENGRLLFVLIKK